MKAGKLAEKIRHMSAEKISHRVLYVLAGIAVVVFGLFYLVGYNRPFDEDPNFNAPLFTNAVIVLMWLMVIGAAGVAAWATWQALKKRGKAEKIDDNHIEQKKIEYGVLLGVLALIVLTFLLGSSEPMTINGAPYANAFWLKATDMFIFTSIILILIAVAAVIYGATRYNRENKTLKQ